MLVVREWPEIAEIILKIFCGERLSGCDEAWMREIAEEIGWNEDDVFEELRNFNVDPSVRTEKYEGLFEKYYREAIEIVGKDARQAGEKMWVPLQP
jgi:8-oxo-dGTP pyrophosphatase MutT (NUDIX family)